jgi:hypothetical protein
MNNLTISNTNALISGITLFSDSIDNVIAEINIMASNYESARTDHPQHQIAQIKLDTRLEVFLELRELFELSIEKHLELDE